MQLYEYIAEAIPKNNNESKNAFSGFKVKKNKNKTNTLIIKPDGERYLIVDLNRLRR